MPSCTMSVSATSWGKLRMWTTREGGLAPPSSLTCNTRYMTGLFLHSHSKYWIKSAQCICVHATHSILPEGEGVWWYKLMWGTSDWSRCFFMPCQLCMLISENWFHEWQLMGSDTVQNTIKCYSWPDASHGVSDISLSCLVLTDNIRGYEVWSTFDLGHMITWCTIPCCGKPWTVMLM